MILANGAQRILQARMKGFKPAEVILVSLVGRINELNHTVYANPEKEYDWRWARDLQVCIYTSPGVNWRPVARSIASERPSSLWVWDVDNREGAHVYLFAHLADIDRPQSEWRWLLDFLPWLPFQNTGFAWK